MSKWICIDNICIPSDENDWDELVAFADAVAEQEPIDLVRCGECKKVDTKKCPFYSAGWGYTDEDYCSCGERRNNE